MTSERSSEARPLPTHDSVVRSKLDDSLVCIQLYFLLESLVQITCLAVAASAISTAGAPGGCGGWCHLPPCWGLGHQPSVTSSNSSSLSQSLQDVMKSSEAFFVIAFAAFIVARATALCSLKITQSIASLLLPTVNLLKRLASKVSSVTVKLPAAIVLLLQQQKARAGADLTITDCFEPMRKWKNYCYSTSQLCMITKVLKVASSYSYSYSDSSFSNYTNYSVATQCSNFISAILVSANQLCTDICLSSSYGCCLLLVSAV